MGRKLETRQKITPAWRRLGVVLLGLTLIAAPAAAQDSTVTALVDAAWLAKNASRADVVMLDVRTSAAYAQAHLDGAVFADYPERWRPVGRSGRRGLMRSTAFAALAGQLGIGNASHVVLVHGGRSAADAARATDLYLSFRIQGHDRVSILNAPLKDVADAGISVSEGPSPRRAPARFEATARAGFVAGGIKVVREAIGRTPLVDMRRDAEFIGLEKAADVAAPGTLPSARNLPNRWLFDEDAGRFRDAETLRQVFALARVPNEGRVIFFSNNTAFSSMGWFVAREILGNGEARVYAGGLGEWMAGDPEENPRVVRLNQASADVAPVKRR